VAVDRPDMAQDPELATNPGRVKRVAEIDEAIAQWTGRYPVDVVVETLNAASVPVGRIYSAQDIAGDPHYRAREMILPVTTHDGLTVEVPGIIPKLSGTPGRITRRGPMLGEDTDAVLGSLPSAVRGEGGA
jgi:formyl-CoA transferase